MSSLHLQIDQDTYKGCRIQDERLFLSMCGIDRSSKETPIPAQPVAELPRIAAAVAAHEKIVASSQQRSQADYSK